MPASCQSAKTPSPKAAVVEAEVGLSHPASIFERNDLISSWCFDNVQNFWRSFEFFIPRSWNLNDLWIHLCCFSKLSPSLLPQSYQSRKRKCKVSNPERCFYNFLPWSLLWVKSIVTMPLPNLLKETQIPWGGNPLEMGTSFCPCNSPSSTPWAKLFCQRSMSPFQPWKRNKGLFLTLFIPWYATNLTNP